MSSSEEAEWNDDDNDNDDAKAKDDEEEEEEDDDEDFDEDGDDDDDDEEDKKPAAKKVSKSAPADDDGDSDSEDDDIPLSALIKPKKSSSSSSSTKKRKAATPKSNGSSTEKKKTKKAPASKKKAPPTPPPAKKKSSSSKSYEYASAALYGTECDKGLLIQRLLCRWWYAYEWPSAAIRNAKPPPDYDALDGFPGVFVCTKGDAVGKILDTRSECDAKRKPSFRNFAQQPAEDLRELLLTALAEQQKQLGETDPGLSKELKSLVKWATKLNTAKADKDARKILTAHGLVL